MAGTRCDHLLVFDLPLQDPLHERATQASRSRRAEAGVDESRRLVEDVHGIRITAPTPPTLPGEGEHDDHEKARKHQTTTESTHGGIVPRSGAAPRRRDRLKQPPYDGGRTELGADRGRLAGAQENAMTVRVEIPTPDIDPLARGHEHGVQPFAVCVTVPFPRSCR
jgi:hypothetical protein